MITTAHQTVNNNGNKNTLKTPIKATDKGGKETYLGEGYYFWDNNIELARWWGDTHYNGRFYIFEAEIEMTKALGFLDLVGNRQDMLDFIKLVDNLTDKGLEVDLDTWELGKIFQFLLEIRKIEGYKNVFPYNVVRVVEYPNFAYSFKMPFTTKTDKFTLLRPRMIICIYELNTTVLKLYKFLEESNKRRSYE